MNKKILLFLVFTVCFAAGVILPRLLFIKNVTVTAPHTGEAVEAIYATGTVEPTILVPIAPRNAGHLTTLAATEGQTVKKGDILATLEDTEQQATIADLTAQRAFAESDFNRKSQLYKSNSNSRDSVDAAKATFESLTAQLDKAKAQAGYMTLIAPADGLIIKRDGEIGEFISAAQPIFYLSCCAPLRITAEVDEEDIPQVKEGQDVLIQSDAFPDQVFHGKISAITPKGDPVARSYRVRMTFDNATAPLLIGMTTETNIIVKKVGAALLIPTTSLGADDQVQVVRDNVVHRVPVKTGIKNVDFVEIKSGLTPTDTVVVPYDATMKDGQKVRTETKEKGAQ